MIAALLPAAWGLVLLGAFAGWGAALERVLGARARWGLGLRAAAGLSAAVVGGGVLNLAGAISRGAVLGFVAAGVTLALADLSVRARSGTPRAAWGSMGPNGAAWAAAVVLAILARYVTLALDRTCNPHDDLQAYFVFPMKMLQTGSLGPEPFSERRIVAGLGGQSFLQTFSLALFPARTVNVVDLGLGLLLLAALALGEASRSRLPRGARALVLATVLVVAPPFANTTALLLAAALFLALAALLERAREEPSRAAPLAPVALVLAALCSLKNTGIPAAALLALVGTAAPLPGGSRRPRLAPAALVAALTATFLLPWMIALHRSSGTLLYPLLGRGFHGAQYGGFPAPWSESTPLLALRHVASALLSDPTDLALVVLVVAALAERPPPAGRRGTALFLGIAATAGVCLTALVMGGFSSARYAFSFAFAGVVGLQLELLAPRDPPGRPAPAWRGWVAGAVAGAIFAASYQVSVPRAVATLAAALRPASAAADAESAEADRHRRLQDALPPGSTVLARLERPYLLDFRRQQVFIADYPGGQSPPPGMPFFEGPEPLAEYLRAAGVRYVAYAYAAQAGFPRESPEYASRLGPGANPWIRSQARHTFDFQDNLDALGRTRARIFDDGATFVLDLAVTSSRGR